MRLRAGRARARAEAGPAVRRDLSGDGRLLLRTNRPADAVAAAQQALKLDKDNVEAHNILGTVYAAWSEGGGPLPPGQTMRPRARRRSST